MNERTNERTNEQTNERTNEQVSKQNNSQDISTYTNLHGPNSLYCLLITIRAVLLERVVSNLHAHRHNFLLNHLKLRVSI